MTAIIRPAEDADQQGLLGLYGVLNPDDSALPEARAQEVWAAIRSQAGRTIMVAVVGDALAGGADCVVLPNLTRGGRSIKIQLLAADSQEAHDFYAACGYWPLAQGFRRHLDEPAHSGHPLP